MKSSEIVEKQNAEVLGHMQRKRDYTPDQMEEISWTISKVHAATTRKVEDFICMELDRVEQEIEQLERQLIEKCAEHRQLNLFMRHVGYQEGMQQINVREHLEGKEGEGNGSKRV